MKAHAYIINEIKSKLPVFGKEERKKKLIKDLDLIYEDVQTKYQVKIYSMFLFWR